MTLIAFSIIEPFFPRQLQLFWPVLVQGTLVSLALGLIGCFLVVRGMSLLGDALSHSVLPGIVIGFLASAKFGTASLHSLWILAGATVVGLCAAVLVQVVQDHSRVKEDASLGIIFTTLFALGVVLVNVFAGHSDLDPGCVLYGDIVNYIIDSSGIWPMAVIAAGIVLTIAVFYRSLLVATFDPGLAISLGIPATFIHYAMMGALSLTIVASFEAIGAILAVALLILPGATARLWADRMPSMLRLAALHGVLSSILGYWLSHPAILNTSASGAICVAGFGLFLLSWLLAPRNGVLVRSWRRYRLRRHTAMENLLRTIREFPQQPASAARIREMLGASAQTFRKIATRAARRGWLIPAEGTLALTSAGRDYSDRLVRAHELWEKYLLQEVGLDADHVHDAAERVEHYLSEEKLGRLHDAVGTPR